MTGSLEAVPATELLGWLGNRDAELELSAIYGNQRVELSVKGGSIRSVVLGRQRLYDRATVLGLGASLVAVRRGAFELRTASERSTERDLGVAFVPWLMSAFSGADNGSPRALEADESLQIEPLALERQLLTPRLRAFLTLGGYALRERSSSRSLSVTLGIDAAWTRERLEELMLLGVLERGSPATHSAAHAVTRVLPTWRRR